jgi:hypothetical protein
MVSLSSVTLANAPRRIRFCVISVDKFFLARRRGRHSPMTSPHFALRAANRVLEPLRLQSWVFVAARPFFNGRRGWVRSNARIWLLSSTQSTRVRSSEFKCQTGQSLSLQNSIRTVITAEVALRILIISAIRARCRMDAGNRALRRFFLAKARNVDVAPASALCERSFDCRGYH